MQITTSENENYELIYSPRTIYNNEKQQEKKLYEDFLKAFDPYTIQILRRHFEEHLGTINKDLFICILKKHLLAWQPKLFNRENILIKFSLQFFEDIDLNSDKKITWNEIINYLATVATSKKSEIAIYTLQKYSQCPLNIKTEYNIN